MARGGYATSGQTAPTFVRPDRWSYEDPSCYEVSPPTRSRHARDPAPSGPGGLAQPRNDG